jgi:hypothetical protein
MRPSQVHCLEVRAATMVGSTVRSFCASQVASSAWPSYRVQHCSRSLLSPKFQKIKARDIGNTGREREEMNARCDLKCLGCGLPVLAVASEVRGVRISCFQGLPVLSWWWSMTNTLWHAATKVWVKAPAKQIGPYSGWQSALWSRYDSIESFPWIKNPCTNSMVLESRSSEIYREMGTTSKQNIPSFSMTFRGHGRMRGRERRKLQVHRKRRCSQEDSRA